jgi:hypothetical protein
MNKETVKYETIDIEEVILKNKSSNIEKNLPGICSDEEAAMLLIHERTGEPVEYMDNFFH